MDKTEHRSFAAPDETREFPRGRAEILKIGGGEVGRLVFQPRWRWSTGVKPIAGTGSCEAPGAALPVPRQRPAGDPDGRRHGIHRWPGDVTSLPSGHAAW